MSNCLPTHSDGPTETDGVVLDDLWISLIKLMWTFKGKDTKLLVTGQDCKDC